MEATETCKYCNTTLEWTGEGRRLRFTAHDADFCKQSALHHKMIIEGILKQDALEKARMQAEVHYQVCDNAELRRALEEVVSLYLAAECVGSAPAETKRVEEIARQFLR